MGKIVAVIIGTHGNFAEELLATGQMIVGDRDIRAVALKFGENLDCLAGK